VSGSGNTGRYAAVLEEQSPHIDSEPPTRSKMSTLDDTIIEAGRVALEHGKWRVSMPWFVFVVVAAIGVVAYVQYRKPAPDDPARIIQEFSVRQAQREEDAKRRDDALNERLTSIDTAISELRSDVKSQERRFTDYAIAHGAPVPVSPMAAPVSRALSKP